MKEDIRDNPIWWIELNIYGAWVIHGCIGIRQYLYYTKREARRMYIEEVHAKRIACGNAVIYRD